MQTARITLQVFVGQNVLRSWAADKCITTGDMEMKVINVVVHVDEETQNPNHN